MVGWVREHGVLGPSLYEQRLPDFRREAEDARRALRLYELAHAGDTAEIVAMPGNMEIEPGRYAISDRSDAVRWAFTEVELTVNHYLRLCTYARVRSASLGGPFEATLGYCGLSGALRLQARSILVQERRPCRGLGLHPNNPARLRPAQNLLLRSLQAARLRPQKAPILTL